MFRVKFSINGCHVVFPDGRRRDVTSSQAYRFAEALIEKRGVAAGYIKA